MADYRYEDGSGNVCSARRVGSRLFSNRPSHLDEEQFIKHIHSLQSRSTSTDDVFICSYPKCGTHWVYDICQMLISEDVAKEPLDLYEFLTKQEEEAFSKPMIIGTHMYPHELPHDIPQTKCKVINVYRNPKDVAISYYFFKAVSSSRDTIPYKGNCSDFIQLFMEGKVQYNSYFDYIDIWKEFEQQHPDFVHVLFYEDLHQNVFREIQRLGRFLGVDASLIESTSFIENIAKKCSFQTIKDTKKEKHAGEYRSFVERLWRKGEVGDWKNYFTVAQNEKMNRLIQQRLQHNISFIYDIPETKTA